MPLLGQLFQDTTTPVTLQPNKLKMLACRVVPKDRALLLMHGENETNNGIPSALVRVSVRPRLICTSWYRSVHTVHKDRSLPVAKKTDRLTTARAHVSSGEGLCPRL